MTPGGAVLVGTTILVAAMDGGLSTLVGSAAAGGIAYVAWRRRPNNITEGVIKTQLNEWQRKLDNEPDADKKKKIQKDMETSEKTYRARLGYDRELIKTAAAAVGLGVAISPVLGVGLLALGTRKYWLPPIVAAIDASRDEAARRADPDAMDMAYVSMCLT